MAPPTQFSPDETLALIAERAKIQDRFIIRLFKKRGSGFNTITENICSFYGAAGHVVTPEIWLPRILGGGEFTIGVFDVQGDIPQRVGGYLPYAGRGPVIEFDEDNMRQAMRLPDWQGPGELITAKSKPEQTNTTFQPTQNPPQIPVPGAPLVTVNGPPAQQHYGIDQEYLRRERELIEREARLMKELSAREEEYKRRELESKMRAENDRTRAEYDAKISKLEALVEKSLSKPEAPKESMLAQLAPLMPLMQMFLQQQHDMRIAMMGREKEAQASALAASQSQQAQMLEMMKSKSGVAPEMQMVMDMMKNQSAGSADMMSRMVEAMGAVSKTSVGMIEAIADINLGGQPEHPIMNAIKEGVKAMGALSRGAQQGAQRAVQAQQPRLPQQIQQQAPQQQQVQQHPQQVPVHNFPPNGAAAAQVPQPNHPPAFDGLPGNPGGPSPMNDGFGGHDPVDYLERMIRSHADQDEVARLFFQSLQHPSMQEALKSADGSVEKLLGDRLGMWAIEPENQKYLEGLQAAFEEAAKLAGIEYEEEAQTNENDGSAEA
jgi:hypothetical protein